MDCCTPKKTPTELKEMECPSCKKRGKRVGRETLDSLLREEARSKILDVPYYFCTTADCEIVYFSTDPNRRFVKDEVTVPVTAKDPGLKVPVCYCFNVTRESVLSEIQKTGTTNAFENISQKVKDGLCSCETMNPQGSCCLGNVSKWIRQAKTIAAQPEVPTKIVQKR